MLDGVFAVNESKVNLELDNLTWLNYEPRQISKNVSRCSEKSWMTPKKAIQRHPSRTCMPIAGQQP